MSQLIYLIIIRFTSLAWGVQGIAHWLFIFGIFKDKEKPPPVIEIFFRSFAILNLAVAFGLWNLLGWGRMLGILVAILHLFAHGYILLSQGLKKVPLERWRFLELTQLILFLVVFNLKVINAMFH